MYKTKTINADTLTVISAYLRLSGQNKFLLESVPNEKAQARYSIIARNPVKTIKAYGHDFYVNGSKRQVLDPLKALQDEVITEDVVIPGFPFQGGAIGYVGFDTFGLYEQVGKVPKDDLGLPDIYFCLYESFIIFDHQKETITIVEMNSYSQRLVVDMVTALQQTIDELWTPTSSEHHPIHLGDFHYQSNFTQDEFETVVKKAKQYIVEGDMFQMVPSQRLSGQANFEPFDYYRKLRITNPSPYLYFMDFGQTQVIGASPESLVAVRDGHVTTNPIAGTRRRGATKQEDERLAYELMTDEKEIAEHKMLVDLGRNDLGRVAEIGSVNVTSLMKIQRYRYVMHLASEVMGRLNSQKSAIDALKATLPAGTVSGAPKIRAIQRIYELEPTKRGVYAGAVGYLSQNDQADFAIAIRTMVVHKGYAHVQAGAGVVYDSFPTNEYQETLQKAKALLNVFDSAILDERTSNDDTIS